MTAVVRNAFTQGAGIRLRGRQRQYRCDSGTGPGSWRHHCRGVRHACLRRAARPGAHERGGGAGVVAVRCRSRLVALSRQRRVSRGARRHVAHRVPRDIGPSFPRGGVGLLQSSSEREARIPRWIPPDRFPAAVLRIPACVDADVRTTGSLEAPPAALRSRRQLHRQQGRLALGDLPTGSRGARGGHRDPSLPIS